MTVFNRRFQKFGITVLSIFISLFISCTTEITLTLQKDDSVDIRFAGGAGEAFAKMTGTSSGLIDADAVSYELAKAGFDNVKVSQSGGGVVLISMCDRKQSSYVFTSGIAKIEKGRIKASITRKSLEDFYASADEQTKMILDLFLAPVFNGEEMSESEYVEMVASFYGEKAANEVNETIVKINLISKDGSKETMKIPLTKLLCSIQ